MYFIGVIAWVSRAWVSRVGAQVPLERVSGTHSPTLLLLLPPRGRGARAKSGRARVQVMYNAEPARVEHIGVEYAELARSTAHQIFADADLNSDGKLSFNEFRRCVCVCLCLCLCVCVFVFHALLCAPVSSGARASWPPHSDRSFARRAPHASWYSRAEDEPAADSGGHAEGPGLSRADLEVRVRCRARVADCAGSVTRDACVCARC